MAFIGGYLVDLASESSLLYQYGPAFFLYSFFYFADAFVIQKFQVIKDCEQKIIYFRL